MLRVTTTFSGLTGAPFSNVLHFGGLDITDAGDAVAAAGAFWGAIDAIMVTECTWAVSADVEVIDPPTGNLLEVLNATAVTGGGGTTSAQLPGAVQGLIRWRTGQIVGGRELRGRTFVPGLAVAVNSDGTVQTGHAATIKSAADALIAVGTPPFGIYSRTHGQLEPVVSSSVWSQFAVLRSRRD
jgi:hypothetical protein